MMTEKAVRKMLADQCDAAGGQKVWAERHGLSASYVCDAIQGRRALGRKLIDALRLRYVAMYVSDDIDDIDVKTEAEVAHGKQRKILKAIIRECGDDSNDILNALHEMSARVALAAGVEPEAYAAGFKHHWDHLATVLNNSAECGGLQ